MVTFNIDMSSVDSQGGSVYITGNIDSSVKNNFMESLSLLSNLGASVEEISLPLTEYALAVYYIIAPSEVCSEGLNAGRGDLFKG